jgi:hypothetical protein
MFSPYLRTLGDCGNSNSEGRGEVKNKAAGPSYFSGKQGLYSPYSIFLI